MPDASSTSSLSSSSSTHPSIRWVLLVIWLLVVVGGSSCAKMGSYTDGPHLEAGPVSFSSVGVEGGGLGDDDLTMTWGGVGRPVGREEGGDAGGVL
jgi:hypothetical protein